MGDIVSFSRTKRVSLNMQQIDFEKVPSKLVKRLFSAAIAVGWAADEERVIAQDCDSSELLSALIEFANKVSAYTSTVNREVIEPV